MMGAEYLCFTSNTGFTYVNNRSKLNIKYILDRMTKLVQIKSQHIECKCVYLFSLPKNVIGNHIDVGVLHQ